MAGAVGAVAATTRLTESAELSVRQLRCKFTSALLGGGQEALARRVGLADGALRVDADRGIGALAANGAALANRLGEQRLGLVSIHGVNLSSEPLREESAVAAGGGMTGKSARRVFTRRAVVIHT